MDAEGWYGGFGFRWRFLGDYRYQRRKLVEGGIKSCLGNGDI